MITWYRDAKTSVKLLTAFALMAFIVAGVGFLGLSKVKLLNGYIDSLYNDSLIMAIDLGHLNEEASNIRLDALQMTSGLSNDNLQQVYERANESARTIDKLMEKIYVSGLHKSEEKGFAEMKDAWKAYNDSRTRTMTLALSGDMDKARENAKTDAGSKYGVLDDKIEAFIDVQDRDGRELFEESAKAEKSATATIAVAILLSVLGAIFVGLFPTSSAHWAKLAVLSAPVGKMSPRSSRPRSVVPIGSARSFTSPAWRSCCEVVTFSAVLGCASSSSTVSICSEKPSRPTGSARVSSCMIRSPRRVAGQHSSGS